MADPVDKRQRLLEERAHLKQSAEDSWVNGDLQSALRGTKRLVVVESELFGADAQLIAERQRRLCELHLELNNPELVPAHLKEFVRLLQLQAEPTSWHHSEIESMQQYISTLLKMQHAARLSLIDTNRRIHQSLQESDHATGLVASEELATIVKQTFGTQHFLWVESVFNVIYLQIALGRLQTAEVQLQRLHNEMDQSVHPQHYRFAALSWLKSYLLVSQGNDAAAERESSNAIRRFEASGATWHPLYAQALRMHSYVVLVAGRHREALTSLRKAYDLSSAENLSRQRQDDQLCLDLCTTLQVVAVSEMDARNPAAAVQLCEEAMDAAEQRWGTDDHRAKDIRQQLSVCKIAVDWSRQQFDRYAELVRLENDATSFLQQNNHSAAFNTAKTAYLGFQELLGDHHPRTLLNRNRQLSAALVPGAVSKDQHEGFKQLVLEFAAQFEAEFGSDHPATADLWYRFSNYLHFDDPDRIRFARQAVDSYQQSLGVESDDYLTALNRLGRWLCLQKDFEAEAVLKKAVRLWKARPSQGSYQHGIAAYWLGYFYYYVADQPYAAARYIRDAADIFRAIPEQTAGLEPALALNLLGNVYSDRESYNEALVHYRKAIELFQQHGSIEKSGEEDTYRWLLYNTARSCFEQRQLEEAQRLLKDLLKRFPQGVNSKEAAYFQGCFALSRVHVQLKQTDQAADVLAQVGYSIQLHHKKQTDVESRNLRAQHAMHLARLTLAQNNPDATREHLGAAWSEYQALADSFEELQPFEQAALTISIDRLLELYERIDAWPKIAEIRSVLVPLCRTTLAEYWPHLFQLEEQYLRTARALAAADAADRRQFNKLISRIRTLKQQQNVDDISEVDDKQAETLIRFSQQILGLHNLPAAEYAQDLAVVHDRRGRVERAAELQDYAVQAYFFLLGGDHPLTAEAQVRRASLHRKVGRYSNARPLLDSAIQTLKEIQGDYHADTILARLELARLHVDVEDYAAALPLSRGVVDAYGSVWGVHNVIYAEALETLGFVYIGMNEQQLAARYILEADQLYDSLLPSDDRRLLRSKSNVAVVRSFGQSAPAQIDSDFQNAVAAFEKSTSATAGDFAQLLVRYGDFQCEQQNFTAASETYRRALSRLDQDRRPNDHGGRSADRRQDALRAAVLFRLGSIKRKSGLHQAALTHLTEALAIQRGIFGDQSDHVSDTLHELARQHAELGQLADAHRCVLESLQIQQDTLTKVGNLLSEKSLSLRLSGQERRLDLLLNLLRQRDSESEGSALSAETGFYWTLQRKGLALDLNCRVRSMQQSALHDSESVNLAEQIRLLNQELANLALLRSDAMTPEKIQAERTRLVAELAVLNSQLAVRMTASVDASVTNQTTVADVRRRLGHDTVFVEYVRIAETTSQASDDEPAARYVAFVLTGSQPKNIRFHDLGPAAEVDRLIGELRDLTRRVPRMLRLSTEALLENQFQKVSQKLRDRLLGFLEAELSQAKSIIVGPDAQILTVPFAALTNSQGRYLVEDLDISYVSSARDLLRKRASPGRGTVILSNPNFDADRTLIESSLKAIRSSVEQQQRVLAMRSASMPKGPETELRSLRWRALPGAEQEAADVQEILTDSEFAPISSYLGSQAVEEVLKSVRTPRILHLATHGFYVPLQTESDLGGRARSPFSLTSGLARLRTDRNPLLRSGIVLAGANRVNQAASTKTGLPEDSEASTDAFEDGWVTAQEIAGMDLRRTELVVLSACESGLGDLSSGQGVQGLRRAFLHAGAHSVLTSLFEVPDTETRDLMRNFYEQLHQHDDRRIALNEAQRQRIKARRSAHEAAHPFFWASFILLDGSQKN